jgi:hypothetical protein
MLKIALLEYQTPFVRAFKACSISPVTSDSSGLLRAANGTRVPVSDLCENLSLNPTVFYRLARGVLRERSGLLPDSGASKPPV